MSRVEDRVSRSLKIISLNIEHRYHINKVVSFLRQEKADVICLQEIYEIHISKLRLSKDSSIEKEYPYYHFVPQARWWKFPPRIYDDVHPRDGIRDECNVGLLLLSKFPIRQTFEIHYSGSNEVVFNRYPVEFDLNYEHENTKYFLAGIEIEIEGTPIKVFTLHFPISGLRGSLVEFQLLSLERLLNHLKQQEGHFILCGDFNSSRHATEENKIIYNRLASQYIDHIPSSCLSSLDPKIHRSSSILDFERLGLLVDWFFSTGLSPQGEGILVKDLRMEEGVSDHKALVAQVELKTLLPSSSFSSSSSSSSPASPSSITSIVTTFEESQNNHSSSISSSSSSSSSSSPSLSPSPSPPSFSPPSPSPSRWMDISESDLEEDDNYYDDETGRLTLPPPSSSLSSS